MKTVSARPAFRPIHLAVLVIAASTVAACGGGSATTGGEASELIAVDGSSTVFPISEAVAEEFQKDHPGTRVTVGLSGTGGGFKKFCRGEIDISDASRPVRPVEIDDCRAQGVDFIELPIAYDGLAVVVNPRNTWVDQLTVEELKRLWEPDAQGTIMRWSQVRAGWPDREVHLFGPGIDSGTFDYFTEAVVGKEDASRGDFTSSEDDNVLVQGVSGDELALGFFGYAYYEENQGRLKLVPIDDGRDDNGAGAIAPSPESVRGGTYRPLSRPLFIYVSTKSYQRAEVKAFVDYYIGKGIDLVREVGYVPLSDREYELVRRRAAGRVTGTMFSAGMTQAAATLERLLDSPGESR